MVLSLIVGWLALGAVASAESSEGDSAISEALTRVEEMQVARGRTRSDRRRQLAEEEVEAERRRQRGFVWPCDACLAAFSRFAELSPEWNVRISRVVFTLMFGAPTAIVAYLACDSYGLSLLRYYVAVWAAIDSVIIGGYYSLRFTLEVGGIAIMRLRCPCCCCWRRRPRATTDGAELKSVTSAKQ